MAAYRQQRGACLIEAEALDLHGGRHWQPWLRLTRCADGVSASQTFDRLKPVFGTEQAALRYAAALGSSLAEEGTALDPAWRNREPATRPVHQKFPRRCTGRLRARAFALAQFIFRAAR